MTKRPPPSSRASRRAANQAGRRSPQPATPRRDFRPWFLAAAVLGLVVLAGGYVLARSSGPTASPSPAASSPPTASAAGGPGLSTANPPWPAETTNLRARLVAMGLPVLAAEGEVLHTHEHLDVVVDGQPVVVPADIGINATEQYLAPIHTHDATGIIHVESPVVRDFSLGEFFDIWGVRLDAHCVGGACDGNGRSLIVYVNGQRVAGDPRAVKLEEHQEILVTLGTPPQLPSPIPSSFDFPAGL